MKKIYFLFIYIFLFGIFSVWTYDLPEYDQLRANRGGKEMVLQNYHKIIDSLSGKFKLPEDYLYALIMLESSGRKRVPVRFEKNVYNKLLLIQKGKIKGFEKVNRNNLKGLSRKELKMLASSYGPFQIMGYKIFELNIPLSELYGKNNIYWALKWIDNNYGSLLRKGDYKNAFHLHNAGKKYPKNGKPETHDPEYVHKGLQYVEYYRKQLKNE